MYFIKTELKRFSAAHRINKNYQGKCQYLHGHDYRLNVILAAEKLNDHDFVIDFDDIKKLLDGWVQTTFDHATLVSEKDASLLDFLRQDQQRYYVVPGGVNTSVESLAKHIYERFCELLTASSLNPTAVVYAVELWESDKSGVIYSEARAQLVGIVCGAS